MAAFASWLVNQIIVWGIKFCNVFIDFLQKTNDSLVDFIIFIVTLLPAGSGQPDAGAMPTGTVMDILLTTLNWLFPISFLVSVVAWVAVALLAYVAIAPLARWAKLLQ